MPGRTTQAQKVHFQDLVPAHFVHFVPGAISEKMMPASAGPNPPGRFLANQGVQTCCIACISQAQKHAFP